MRRAALLWSTTPPHWSTFHLKQSATDFLSRVVIVAVLTVFKYFPSASLTVECVDIQQHCALPLVGGPLQLGGRMDSSSRSWELQRSQQFVLAQ